MAGKRKVQEYKPNNKYEGTIQSVPKENRLEALLYAESKAYANLEKRKARMEEAPLEERPKRIAEYIYTKKKLEDASARLDGLLDTYGKEKTYEEESANNYAVNDLQILFDDENGETIDYRQLNWINEITAKVENLLMRLGIPEELLPSHLFDYVNGNRELTEEVIQKEKEGSLLQERIKEGWDPEERLSDDVPEVKAEEVKEEEKVVEEQKVEEEKVEEEKKEEPRKEEEIKEEPKQEKLPTEQDKEVAKQIYDKWGFINAGNFNDEKNVQLMHDQMAYDQQSISKDANIRLGSFVVGGFFLNGDKLLTDERLKNKIPTLDMEDAIGESGVIADRRDTVASIFQLWCMGEKGMSFEETLALSPVPQVNDKNEITNMEELQKLAGLREEFFNFCKENPVKRTFEEDGNLKQEFIDKETVMQSITKWTQVFDKATDKVREYKLPEIDFGNIEEIRGHFPQLYFVTQMAINYGQELDRIKGKFPGGKEIEDNALAPGKAQQNRTFWYNIQSVNNCIIRGYFSDPGKDPAEISMKMDKFAAHRAVAGVRLNPFGGKSLEEVNQVVGSNSDAEMLMQEAMASELSMAEKPVLYGFLSGEDKTPLTNMAKNILPEHMKKRQEEAVIRQVDAFNNMLLTVDFNAVKSKMDGIENAEQARDFLKDPDSLNWLNDQYRNQQSLLSDSNREILRAAKVQPSDVFRFDGKSAEELWGEKYKDVTDPAEKENLYRLEILGKIAKGDSQVTLRTFDIQADNSYKEGDAFLMLDTKENMEKLAYHLAEYEVGVESFTMQLKTIRSELSKTQENPTSNFEGKGSEGSSYYQNMTKSLQNCIDMLEAQRSGDKDYSLKEIKAALQQYKDASATYEENRKGRLFGPITQSGRDRLELSRQSQTIADDLLKQYEALSKSFHSKMVCNGDGTDFEHATYEKASFKLRTLMKNGHVEQPDRKEVEKGYVLTEIRRPGIAGRILDLARQAIDMAAPANPKKADQTKEWARDVVLRSHYSDLESKPDLVTLNRARNIDTMIKNTAENSVFREMVTDKGLDYTIGHWSDVERRSDELREQLRSENAERMNLTHPQSGKYIATLTEEQYVAGFGSDPSMLSAAAKVTPEETLRMMAEFPDQLDAAYGRLSEVTVNKLLLEDDKFGREFLNRIVVNADENKVHTKEQLERVTKELFKNNHILEGGKLNKALDRLASGKLSQELVTAVKQVLRNDMQANKNINIQAEDLNVDKKMQDAGYTVPKEKMEGHQKHREFIHGIMKEGNEAISKLSRMEKGAETDGKLWEEKIHLFTKIAAADQVRRNQEKFNTRQEVNNIEKEFYKSEEFKQALVRLAWENSGADLIKIIKGNDLHDKGELGKQFKNAMNANAEKLKVPEAPKPKEGEDPAKVETDVQKAERIKQTKIIEGKIEAQKAIKDLAKNLKAPKLDAPKLDAPKAEAGPAMGPK